MIDTKQHVNSLISNIVEDKYGNKVDIYTYCAKSYMAVATEMPQDTPIGCISKEIQNGAILRWEDNDYRGTGLLDRIHGCIEKSVFGEESIIEDVNGKERHFKVITYSADYLAVVRIADNIPISCGAINPNGEIVCFWIDAEFRGSKSIRLHDVLALGYALKHGYMANGLDTLFTVTHKDNIPSNKFQLALGFKLVGVIMSSGIEYNRYEQSVKSCISIVEEFAKQCGTII